MRSFFYRAAGVVLVISAAAGVLLAVLGIWGVWKIKPEAEAVLTDTTQMAVDGIDLLDSALGDVAGALETVDEGLQSVNSIKDNLAEMMVSITPILDRTSEFVGEDLVGVMEGLQDSLDTLENGMDAVQNALSFLDLIPGLGLIYNNTSATMTEGVDEMSGQVDTLSDQLSQFEGDLSSASESLSQLQEDIKNLAATVDEADLTMEDQLETVYGYQDDLRVLRRQMLDFRERWLRNIQRIAIGSTVVFSWLLVMMVSLIVLGGDLALHGDQRQREREKAAIRQTLQEELRPQLRAELLAELRAELGLQASTAAGVGYPLPPGPVDDAG
ncbi:MAG: hypothetical protein HPY85_09445 [Anaerolineae bacterium]|nr:hypothetical protein [Anaerolineae bacterium]